MIILTVFLSLTTGIFAFSYFSLRKSVQRLSQDVLKKKELHTNLLLTNPESNKVITPLIQEINEVFREFQELKIMNQHEKHALDLAIIISRMISVRR